MVFQRLNGEGVDGSLGFADPTRRSGLPPQDRGILTLIDSLGYTVAQTATLLKIKPGDVKRRYWRAKDKLRPPRLITEEFLAKIPGLLARDVCALMLVESGDYSIGQAAVVLGINKGHLCRRLEMARELIRQHGDPRATPT